MADFTIGDYQYTIWDTTNNNVSAQVVDNTKAIYENIPKTVTYNDIVYNVTALNGQIDSSTREDSRACFYGCTNLKKAPIIPDSVTAIDGCFMNCTSLKLVPELPASVYYMRNCFYGCTSLTTAPIISSSVIRVNQCFRGCTNLTGTIHVYNNPLSYSNIFVDTTKSIYIIPHGSNTVISAWRTIASTYDNVTVLDEPAIDTYYDTTNETSSITFGGYEEADTIDKITSYYDVIGEANTGFAENDDDFNESLIEYGYGDLLSEEDEDEVNEYFYFKIDDPTTTANVGFKRIDTYYKNNSSGTDQPLDRSKFTKYTADPVFEYSYNKTTWNSYTLGTSISIGNGETSDIVYFRGDNLLPWVDGYNISVTETIEGEEKTVQHYYGVYINAIILNSRVQCGGNIMSLRYTSFQNQKTIPCVNAFSLLFSYKSLLVTPPVLPAINLKDNCYGGISSYGVTPMSWIFETSVSLYLGMFSGCTSLTSVPKLPATTLAYYCYAYMFSACSLLTSTPSLPATILANGCYEHMFSGCRSLISAPELPVMTLTNNCYSHMFNYCTSLIVPPELPATTLTNYCYSNMFYGCTSLIIPPELPATTLANYCYSYMFSDCTSLISPPELPATTLADNCYQYMFSGCTSLISPPELLAEVLTGSCYSNMFNGCTSLTSAPTLPATTLTNHCYQYMFHNCKSLTSAPALPATTLANSCYFHMFSNCRSLKSTPSLPATTLADSCYEYMFLNCMALTSISKLPATTLADYCYYEMFYDAVRASSSNSSPCTNSYRIPKSGTGTDGATKSLYNMFGVSGNEFTPSINTTFYIEATSF